LALRHTNSALLEGGYIPLDEANPNVLAYLRKSDRDAVLVVINMSAAPQNVGFDLPSQGLDEANVRTLWTTQTSLEKNPSLRQLALEPLAAYIADVGKRQ